MDEKESPLALREALGRALHKHSFWDDARNWDDRGMPERTKEDWRKMADRFLEKVCPRFGIEVHLSK